MIKTELVVKLRDELELGNAVRPDVDAPADVAVALLSDVLVPELVQDGHV